MPAFATQRDRLKASTRQRILDAAAAALNGGGAARMEDIAAGAGIAVGTLYNYFEDRQALVATLLQLRTRALIEQLDVAAAEAAASPADAAGFTAELARFVDTVASHWDANRKLFTLLIEHDLERGVDPASYARRESYSTQVLARAERVMARGIDAGLLRPVQPTTYAAMVLGMVRSLALASLATGNAHLARRGDEIVHVFLNGAAR